MEQFRFVYPEVFVLTVSLKMRVFSGDFNRTHFELGLHHIFNFSRRELIVGLLSIFFFKRMFQLPVNDKIRSNHFTYTYIYFLSLDFGLCQFSF